MNIKQKLTWAFAVIAGLPVILVATLVVLNLRSEAREGFVDGSSREIRQVANAMQLFFEGISQNVDYLAAQPLVSATGNELKKYMSADAAQIALGEPDKKLHDFFASLAASHPAYSYLSYGLSDGGYAMWPGDAKMANYDPRQRPWYQAAMASPGKTPCAPTPTTGPVTMRCWSAPCGQCPTSSATPAAWSVSTSRSSS
ncbi:UNVERIFIED_ORG: hypothetical protein OKW25_000697 [Pseudomonas vranovensis]|nr:hypothetical protein [Pseudomonas vranovensis]